MSDYTSQGPSKNPSGKPLVDMVETEDSFMIMVDLPGVKKEDVDIGISKDNLEITAQFEEEGKMDSGTFVQKERNYGEVHRSIPLSAEINVKKATANFKDCVLTVTLPKAQKEITKVKIG